jgi:hypothetical protein
MQLKELQIRDSYSHELAEIFVGANSQRALLRTYRDLIEILNIKIGDAL